MKLALDEGEVFLDGVPIAQMASLNVTTSKDASCEIRKFNTPTSVSATGKAVFNQELIVKMLNDIVEHQEKLIKDILEQEEVIADAIKKSQAIKVVTQKERTYLGDGQRCTDAQCPSCNSDIYTLSLKFPTKYCMWCGQKLDWKK